MSTKSDCDKLLSAQFLQLGDSVKLRVSLQPQSSSQPQAKTSSKTLPDASPSQPSPTSLSAPTSVSKHGMKDSEIPLQGPLSSTRETKALPQSSASSGIAAQQSENVSKTIDPVSSAPKPTTSSGNDSTYSLGDQQPTRQTEKKRRREEDLTDDGVLTSGGNDAEAKSSDDNDTSRPAVRQKTSHLVDVSTPAKTLKSADTGMDCSNSSLQSAMKPDSSPAGPVSGNKKENVVAMKSSSSPVVNAKQISTAAPSTTVSSLSTPPIPKSKQPLSPASATVIPPSIPTGAPVPQDINAGETSTGRASPSGAFGAVSAPEPPSVPISIPVSVPLPVAPASTSVPSTPSPGAISTERLFPNGRILPKEHLSQPITKSELRELRHWVFDKGTDVEQLAFKMLQELILSPILGIREDYLGPLNNALMKDMADQYAVPHEGIFARFSDVRKVFNGPKKEFAEGNEEWMKKQTKEQLAVSLFEENLEFLFKPFQHGENNKTQSPDTFPTRGTFGSRSLDRARSDGAQQTRYQDKVSDDNLYNILSAYMFKKDSANIRTTEPHSDF